MHNEALLAVRNTAVKLALGFPAARNAMANELAELAVSYPTSPLNGKDLHGLPKPGERAPIRADEPAVGSGGTPRFALYAPPSADADQFIACFPDVVEPQPRPPFKPGSICVVRPDGYIAFAGDTNAWPQADAYMVQFVFGIPQQKVYLES
jgi:hypothetical protein